MAEGGYSPEQSIPQQITQERVSLPPELEATYLQKRESIKDVYKNVWVWHGTGRYDKRGDNTVDILSEILSADETGKPRGFIPHNDVWAGNEQATISATVTRPLATLYSDMHFPQGEDELVFKDKRKLKMGRRTAPHALSLVRHLPHILSQKQTAAIWMEQKTGQKVDGNIWKASMKFGSRRSTISEDYPILVAFKHDAFEPIPTPSYISATEVRTDSPISLDRVNHIEVPLKNVEQTLILLKEKSIEMRVIPREFGERYSSEFTDDKVLSGEGFLKTA